MITYCAQLPCGLVVPKTFLLPGEDGYVYEARLFASGTEKTAKDYRDTVLVNIDGEQQWHPAGELMLRRFNDEHPWVRGEVDVLAVGEIFGTVADDGTDYRFFPLLNASTKPQPRHHWWLTQPLPRHSVALGIRQCSDASGIPF